MRQRIAAMATAVLLAAPVTVMASAAPADAAPGPGRTGCYWKQNTVKVWINPNVHAWGVRRAMRIWNSFHRGQPHLQRTYRKAGSNIRVSAYWNYTTTQNGSTAFGCGWDFASPVVVKLNSARPITFNDRRVVAIHEMGHALGLAHRTSGYTIMRPRLSRDARYPTLLDRRTLGRIY